VVLGKTPAHPVEHTASSGNDAEFQAELRRDFIQTLPGTLNALRAAVKNLIKADNEMARLSAVQELYRRIHALTGNAGVAGMMLIAQMADATEALLKELYEKPKTINASTMRTVANAVDFLGVLFERGTLPDRQEVPSASILVVDDESISRRAVTYALEKAKLKSVSVEDPNQAFKMITENRFDLIFLDVDMPGMNGFELCSKLRALPSHKNTPVVFVTSLNDFESRANSTISGGNDFIAKPFLFIELAVKALVYVRFDFVRRATYCSAMDSLHAPWRIDYILSPKPVLDESLFSRIAQSNDDEENLVVVRERTCYALLNRYPYNGGHLMVVPYKQTPDLSGLTEQELADLMVLTRRCQNALTKVMRPDGFNIGINIGKCAGAGIVEHLHLHIVPRWSGDTNFMPVIADTGVLPQALREVAAKIREVLATTA